GGLTGTLASGFTVNPDPTLGSVSPASRGQGVIQDLTFNGTGFVLGATVSFSGTGITVNTVTFVTAKKLTVNVTIAPNAPTGAQNATVVNPDAGAVTRTNAFTVNAKPVPTSVSPPSKGQGATSQVVQVLGTGFASGATVSFSGAGI